MKKMLLVSILSLFIFFTACSRDNLNEDTIANSFQLKEVISTSSLISRLQYSTLQQLLGSADWGGNILEDYSADIVVIGEFITDGSNDFIYDYNEYFEKDVVVDAFAKGQFK
ncbi:MAG: hypothetical protein LBC71_04485 [Oscillospiraceae bacterium]|jgi:hypothetical protein|nr:hypothetical protein [Oscillospiraceae bacterium]